MQFNSTWKPFVNYNSACGFESQLKCEFLLKFYITPIHYIKDSFLKSIISKDSKYVCTINIYVCMYLENLYSRLLTYSDSSGLQTIKT